VSVLRWFKPWPLDVKCTYCRSRIREVQRWVKESPSVGDIERNVRHLLEAIQHMKDEHSVPPDQWPYDRCHYPDRASAKRDTP